MSRRTTIVVRWTLGGALFGLTFPLVAWLIAGGGIGAEAIRLGHDAQPVLWIIDLAPFVLAGAGALVGFQNARLDAALQATDQKVRDRTAELEAAYARLEDLMSSKDQFVAMVGHEVRNPLTVVMGFAEELRTGLDNFSRDEVTDLAGLIADQSMEISNIIEDMLVAARADMGPLTVVAEETDLVAQAEMVVRACVCAAPIRDSIEMIMAPTKALADPGRVRQIVRNLITNAVRYGGDQIYMVVSEHDEGSSICVCDNGNGIPEAEREAVFEAYQQSTAGKKVAGSVGLGLHVSRTLARAMGGDLTYRYDDGHSIFELSLPAFVEASESGPVSQFAAR